MVRTGEAHCIGPVCHVGKWGRVKGVAFVVIRNFTETKDFPDQGSGFDPESFVCDVCNNHVSFSTPSIHARLVNPTDVE